MRLSNVLFLVGLVFSANLFAIGDEVDPIVRSYDRRTDPVLNAQCIPYYQTPQSKYPYKTECPQTELYNYYWYQGDKLIGELNLNGTLGYVREYQYDSANRIVKDHSFYSKHPLRYAPKEIDPLTMPFSEFQKFCKPWYQTEYTYLSASKIEVKQYHPSTCFNRSPIKGFYYGRTNVYDLANKTVTTKSTTTKYNLCFEQPTTTSSFAFIKQNRRPSQPTQLFTTVWDDTYADTEIQDACILFKVNSQLTQAYKIYKVVGPGSDFHYSKFGSSTLPTSCKE